MIRVVLVDDEPFLLETLEKAISWKDYDMTVAGAFYNGRQALDYIEHHDVDVVISDIVMPVMDGMELLKNVRQINPDTEFVVLSSYSEFELVRDFFREGAFDYLTKIDIDSDQTANMLLRLQEEMIRKKTAGNKEAGILFFLNHILQESGNKDIRFALASLRIPNLNYLHDFNESIRKLADAAVGRCYNSNMGNAVFLLSESEVKQGVPDRIEEVIHKASYRILGGISTWDYADCMETLLDEAEKGANYSFYEERGLVRYIMIPARNQKVRPTKIMVFDMCRMYIENNLLELNLYKLRDKIEDAFEAYRKWNISYGELIKEAEDLFLYLNELFYREGFGDEVMNEKIQLFQNEIADAESYGKLRQIFARYLEELYDNIGGAGTDKLIGRIKQYIDRNYDQDLNLREIAKRFGISENYLSRRFARENNITFKRYVNLLKIEKAKGYLDTTVLRVGEICELLGYHNVEHFSRTFKEETGFSPTEYRNMKR